MNHRARPRATSQPRDYMAANFASRTMRWTGIIVGLFMIFHLADLTWGSSRQHRLRARRAPTGTSCHSLEPWPVAIIYIVANLALGFHLFHGAWSIFQSLGFNNPRFNPLGAGASPPGSPCIVAGINISFPIAVLTGVISVG